MPSRLSRSIQYCAGCAASALVDLGSQRVAILDAMAGAGEAIIIREFRPPDDADELTPHRLVADRDVEHAIRCLENSMRRRKRMIDSPPVRACGRYRSKFPPTNLEC